MEGEKQKYSDAASVVAEEVGITQQEDRNHAEEESGLQAVREESESVPIVLVELEKVKDALYRLERERLLLRERALSHFHRLDEVPHKLQQQLDLILGL